MPLTRRNTQIALKALEIHNTSHHPDCEQSECFVAKSPDFDEVQTNKTQAPTERTIKHVHRTGLFTKYRYALKQKTFIQL